MARLKLLLLIMLIALGCVPAQPPAVARAKRASMELQDLWLDVSMGPPLVDWFNAVARPKDIARADHVSQIRLLEDVHNARRLVVFKSAASAEDAVPAMADMIDIIGYNLESGPANPLEEQAHPLEYVQRMHDLARDYDLLLAVGPDRNFALDYGVEIAPYVDLFVLQIQRIQTEPDTVRDFVIPLVEDLRSANPDIQISVQIRTEGDVVALVDLIESLQSYLDGVSILTSPETVDVAAALVTELRQRGMEFQPTVRPSPTGELVSPAGEEARSQPELPEPSVVPDLQPKQAVITTPTVAAPPLARLSSPGGATEPVANEAGAPSRFRPPLWPLLAAGGLVMAIAAGSMVGALVVMANRQNTRK